MDRMAVGLTPIVFLCVSGSAAAPAPFSFITGSALTRLQADNDNIILPSPSSSNLSASRQSPQDLSNPRDELQPIPNAFFPTYGIVLLVLFIVICILSSILVLVTMHSRATREWIGTLLGRVYSRFSRNHHGSGVHTDTQKGSSTEKNRCDSQLDILPVHGNPSSRYNISLELMNKPKATASEETVTTIPDAPFSVSGHSPSPSSQKHSASKPPLSPHDSVHFGPPSRPLSPFLDHLQTLLSTSKRMFQVLTADSSAPHSPSPNDIVNVDPYKPAPAEFDAVVPRPPIKRSDSDGIEIMKVEGDTSCEDIVLTPVPTATGMKQSGLHQSDHSTTHSSTSIRSRSGFYTLSGDAQLSASTAFHSFIDLSMLATLSDTHADIIPANPSDEEDPVKCVLSPRYVHGLQLETIHEESDVQNTPLTLAPSTSAVGDDSPVSYHDKSDNPVSTTSHDILTSSPEIRVDALNKAQHDSTAFSEQMPISKLAHGQFLPPRFFPAARPPPPPSEPTSTAIQVMSALRSPERQDRRRSVAWLQPVIDWAVDHPQDDCDYDPKAGDLEDIDMESDAECAEALHAADAMAAVMDSLAAIGMDPSDMGLVTEEAISSTLNNSSFHSMSSSLFADSEAFRASPNARAVEADLIEEQEVEHEIGASVGAVTPQKSDQKSGVFTNTKIQYRNMYQDRQQGESIKTALISLLSPSSSRIGNSGEFQSEAHELSDTPTSPERGSNTGRMAARRDSGRDKFQNRSADDQEVNRDSKNDAGRARSPTTSRTVTRPTRAVPQGRVYASPSSLAGLSPLEVAKKFSNTSVSSAGSTPSPSGTRAASPQHRPSPVPPLQLRRTKGATGSPSFDCAASTLISSSRHDPVSPSPRSRTPISHRQYRQQHGEPSDLGYTKSTPVLLVQHDTGFLPQFSSSPIYLSKRQKSPAASALARPPPVLLEKTNSMGFELV